MEKSSGTILDRRGDDNVEGEDKRDNFTERAIEDAADLVRRATQKLTLGTELIFATLLFAIPAYYSELYSHWDSIQPFTRNNDTVTLIIWFVPPLLFLYLGRGAINKLKEGTDNEIIKLLSKETEQRPNNNV